ncbi:MAG TPA: LysR substrate-binding domain-containing protein [Candidatus Baltobacteraceae bacterium]|nr:LysR substrate-binding domain-containing protein [Candidatus Baltobacteraceae bacterium]
MNVKDLQYALALERRRSFSRAAEDCGVAQPTLSAQIRKLEGELGIELFERDGRTIRVTPAGELILDQARVVLEAVGRIEELAQVRADPMVGPIRLGVIPTLAPYLLPEILTPLQAQLPFAPLVVVEDMTHRLIESIDAGRLDAALVATDHSDGNLSEIALFEEPFSLALPLEDPLATHERVRVEQLDPSALILLADGHCLSDQALALCGQTRGRGLRSDLSATSLETVLNLVEAGLGMTIVPELARAHFEGRFSRIAFRTLEGPHSARSIRVIHRAFVPRRPAIERLAATIRKSVPMGSPA